MLGFFSTLFYRVFNYVINEWLDAEFDKYHPTKKYRSVVQEDVKGVYCLSGIYDPDGYWFRVWLFCRYPVLACEVWLWVMGIFCECETLCSKDVAILDVLSESVNNAIRLLIGWFLYYPGLLSSCQYCNRLLDGRCLFDGDETLYGILHD